MAVVIQEAKNGNLGLAEITLCKIGAFNSNASIVCQSNLIFHRLYNLLRFEQLFSNGIGAWNE